MVDPERTYVDATVELAPDVTLFPGTILQGRCVVGAGAEIGPDTRLVDCVVGAGAVVENTVGRDAEIGDGRRRRPVRRARARQQHPCRRPHRAVLHCRLRLSRPVATGRCLSRRGTAWNSSPRSACTSCRVEPTCRSPRRSPSVSGSRWATPTWRSSPTASCTAASASRSAAPTSSSSRPTPAPRACRSTTRSWSS